MTVRRINRVYYDLPNYIKPKEVAKLFVLMKKRGNLMREIDNQGNKAKKQLAEDKLQVLLSDLEMLADVITPNGANWGIQEHKTGRKAFYVLTIWEPVTESIFDKGQDDD